MGAFVTADKNNVKKIDNLASGNGNDLEKNVIILYNDQQIYGNRNNKYLN